MNPLLTENIWHHVFISRRVKQEPQPDDKGGGGAQEEAGGHQGGGGQVPGIPGRPGGLQGDSRTLWLKQWTFYHKLIQSGKDLLLRELQGQEEIIHKLKQEETHHEEKREEHHREERREEHDNHLEERHEERHHEQREDGREEM